MKPQVPAARCSIGRPRAAASGRGDPLPVYVRIGVWTTRSTAAEVSIGARGGIRISPNDEGIAGKGDQVYGRSEIYGAEVGRTAIESGNRTRCEIRTGRDGGRTRRGPDRHGKIW